MLNILAPHVYPRASLKERQHHFWLIYQSEKAYFLQDLSKCHNSLTCMCQRSTPNVNANQFSLGFLNKILQEVSKQGCTLELKPSSYAERFRFNRPGVQSGLQNFQKLVVDSKVQPKLKFTVLEQTDSPLAWGTAQHQFPIQHMKYRRGVRFLNKVSYIKKQARENGCYVVN